MIRSEPPATTATPGRLVIGEGARHLLRRIVSTVAASHVLVVGSLRSAQQTDVPAQLDGFDVRWFTDFTPNPVLEQALAGSALRLRCTPDLIVAVGGGSAIDTAKLLRSLPPSRAEALRVLAGAKRPQPVRPVPLVAIPTTAGTGSEVTRFATVYVDGVKMSLDHPSAVPEYALVDPELLRTCPPWLLHSAAFDTFCHAVESYWSRRATPQSRRLALDALHLVAPALHRGLMAVCDADRTVLATAATKAGQAIDITRTTAAHAFSYRLTAQFRVPHGVACMLNLLWLIGYNVEHTKAATELATLTSALSALQPAATVTEAVRSMLVKGGFSDRLRSYGVRPADVADLVDAGMASGRMSNNPVDVRRDLAIERMLSMV